MAQAIVTPPPRWEVWNELSIPAFSLAEPLLRQPLGENQQIGTLFLVVGLHIPFCQ